MFNAQQIGAVISRRPNWEPSPVTYHSMMLRVFYYFHNRISCILAANILLGIDTYVAQKLCETGNLGYLIWQKTVGENRGLGLLAAFSGHATLKVHVY